MAVPPSGSLYWKVSYAVIVGGTCTSVFLIAAVRPDHTIVWLVSMMLLGLMAFLVLRVAERKLAGGGWPQMTAEDRTNYWTPQRRLAAGGGLGAMTLLAVVVALTMPSILGALAFALMIGILGWMLYVMRDRP